MPLSPFGRPCGGFARMPGVSGRSVWSPPRGIVGSSRGPSAALQQALLTGSMELPKSRWPSSSRPVAASSTPSMPAARRPTIASFCSTRHRSTRPRQHASPLSGAGARTSTTTPHYHAPLEAASWTVPAAVLVVMAAAAVGLLPASLAPHPRLVRLAVISGVAPSAEAVSAQAPLMTRSQRKAFFGHAATAALAARVVRMHLKAPLPPPASSHRLLALAALYPSFATSSCGGAGWLLNAARHPRQS